MFKQGDIVKRIDGENTHYMWGDVVEIEFYRVNWVNENGTVELHSHPYHWDEADPAEFEYHCNEWDSFEPNDNGDKVVPNEKASQWWYETSDEYKEDSYGPYWMEWV